MFGEILKNILCRQPLIEASQSSVWLHRICRDGCVLSDSVVTLWGERDNSLSPCNCFSKCYVTGIVLLQNQDHFSSSSSSSSGLKTSVLLDYSFMFKLIWLLPLSAIMFIIKMKWMTSLTHFTSGQGFCFECSWLTGVYVYTALV